MRTLHLTIIFFIQVLITSFILYTSVSQASALSGVQSAKARGAKQVDRKQNVAASPVAQADQVTLAKKQEKVEEVRLEAKEDSQAGPSKRESFKVNAKDDNYGNALDSPVVIDSSIIKEQIRLNGVSRQAQSGQVELPLEMSKKSAPEMPGNYPKSVQEPVKSAVNKPVLETRSDPAIETPKSSIVSSKPENESKQQPEARSELPVKDLETRKMDIANENRDQVASMLYGVESVQASKVSHPPVVKGGLGPLHLLAATLCSYEPDRPTADDQVLSLYNQRAAVRKALFDFMSLKFTNLEKLSSRLNPGLEVMPPKPVDPSSANKVTPTHGWPLVENCTAYDLRLMAEAAWCECSDASSCESYKNRIKTEEEKPKRRRRSIDDLSSLLPLDPSSPNSPQIIPKLVDSIINGQISRAEAAAPIESSLANLNLTQQQLSVIQAQAGLTQECKRNALRLTKALFNHLAEDQSKVSESWPKLYHQMSEDDCARRRVIDIVTALSGFRTDSTSVRRDNVEFAFAMDDLRAKVLDSDINAPLTFDKQFIEVEQFLQQSVKLMLANIDPERAKLTQMRYRSLMPGADDQCVQLHQLLLAKSHPTDCNPNQYGQLPDVLRMAANSLALWSIENELSRLVFTRSPEYNPIGPLGPNNKQDVNACIANLVSS